MKPTFSVALVLGANLFAGACTFVGEAEYRKRLTEMDDDGDGFALDGGGDESQIDCDDSNSEINPGVEETWYDGIDSDCAEDDDFDADLDGQCHLDHSTAAGRTCEDCNDESDQIYFGAPDTWYDGIDSDCGGENLDFDQDGDGFDCNDDPAVTGDCDGHTGTDCDDTDPTTYEGALEQLSDTVDHDCDGDGARFLVAELLDYSWTNPQSAVLAANDTDVYLSVVTEQVLDNPNNTSHFDTAAALRWSRFNLEDGPQELVLWQNWVTADQVSMTPGQGFYITNSHIYGVTGSNFGASRYLDFSEYSLITQTKVGLSKSHNAGEATYCPAQNCPPLNAFSDISLDIDGTNSVVHILGCDQDDTGSFQYLRLNSAERQLGQLEPSNPSSLENGTDLFGARPSSCQVSVQSGTTGGVILADEAQGGRHTEWSFELGSTTGFDPSVVSFDNTLPVDDVSRYVDFSGGTTHIVVTSSTNRIYVVQGGSQQSITPASGNTPVQATAAEDSGGQIYVAWAEQNGDVGLAWGTMGGGFFNQASVNTGVSADEVHIAVPDGTHVLLAVLGEGQVHAGIAVQ